MDGIKTSMDSVEISLKRLASAVEALEWATDLRMRHDEARASTQEEFALMQDDRSRLAVEISLKRLASAVEALEWATDLRMRHDEARASTQEEFALMQDDRSRLAV